MPAASASKRVKNTRISRAFIIGSQAWPLDPKNHPTPIPEGHTKGWKVYVRALPDGPDLTTWLKKVQFKLHHTYTDASRTVEAPPFEVSETGYGEFDIEMRLYFDSSSGEKAQYRFHRLRLEPFGDEEQVEKQKRDGIVTAEICEIVEFNEPSNELFAKLTAEDQFAHLVKRGKGKGKGRKNGPIEYEGGKEPGASLPERSTEENPWSREYEAQILEMLGKAGKELDGEIEREKERARDRQRRLQGLST